MQRACRGLASPVPAAAPAQRQCRTPRRACRRAHKLATCSNTCASDVAIIDAQNVLSRALADQRRGCRLAGETAADSFADWLHFVTALAEPQLLVAVFDAPAIKRGVQQRQQLSADYLQRRHRRQRRREAHPGSLAPAPAPASGVAGSPAGMAAVPAGNQAPKQPAAGPGGDPHWRFKQRVQQLGGVFLEAANGLEADDGIAAVCAAVRQRHPTARVLVVSGDGDMQQLLSQQVAWLQLHNQASLSCPLAVELITAAAFQQQHGFPASAYADWRALVGKKEASIGGSGVGGKSAAKLLARYGSLEEVLAAAGAGKLRGWGPSVAQLVMGASSSSDSGGSSASSQSSSSSSSGGGSQSGSSRSGSSSGGKPSSSGPAGKGWELRQAQLRRNLQLFRMKAEPCAVDAQGWEQLMAALQKLQPAAAAGDGVCSWHGSCDSGGSSGSGSGSSAGAVVAPSAELAWQHPLHARRRRHLQRCWADDSIRAAVAPPTGETSHDGTDGISHPHPHPQLKPQLQRRRFAATPEGLAVDELWELPEGSSGSGDSSTSASRAVFYVTPCDLPAGAWPRALAAVRGQPEGADSTRSLLPLLHGAMQHHVRLVQRSLGHSVHLRLGSGAPDVGPSAQ